jgi:hypothetical protein
MSDEYTRVPANEARTGDEIYLADKWHATKGVAHMPGGRTHVRFRGGGSVSGPTQNFMWRRPVEAGK